MFWRLQVQDQGHGPCKALPFSAPGAPRQTVACGHVPPVSARSLFSVFLTQTLVGFSAVQIIQDDLFLKLLITSAKTLFPIRNKVPFMGSGHWDLDTTWGPPSTHDTGTQGWGWSTPGGGVFPAGGADTSRTINLTTWLKRHLLGFPKMGFQSAPYKPVP